MSLQGRLENDHNVYILGAGFSRDAGLPLISDFLLKMRDGHGWLMTQNRKREAEAVANVLKFRQQAASAAYWVNLDLENIEELFSLASVSSGAINEDIRLAISATLDYSQKTKGSQAGTLSLKGGTGAFSLPHSRISWLSQGKVSPDGSYCSYTIKKYTLIVANLLGMLDNTLPKGRNTFITFNYDTLLEEALAELSLPVTYGSRFCKHPSSNGRESMEHIPVFKLHGSTNWVRDRQGDPNGVNSISVTNSYSEIIARESIPELIPPTWKKLFDSQHEAVWEDAIQSISTATRIIVIGFSIPPTDLHFKYLLAAGLKENISLRKIAFVNLEEKEPFQARVKALLRNTYVDSDRIEIIRNSLSGIAIPGQDRMLDAYGRVRQYSAQYNFFESVF